jgi:hypothetical protein
MRALLTRELIVSARRPAVTLSACGIAILLTGFVLVWAPGVAVLAPMSLYEQTRALHWLLLAVALPWTALRSAAADRGDALVLLTVFTGLRPGRVVLGKIIATFVVLVLVIMTGLPSLVIAQQAAAVPFRVVLGDLLPLLGIALLVAVSATASILVVADTLGAWLAATGAVLLVLLGMPNWMRTPGSIGLTAALVGLIAAGWMHERSSRLLRHLEDIRAE